MAKVDQLNGPYKNLPIRTDSVPWMYHSTAMEQGTLTVEPGNTLYARYKLTAARSHLWLELNYSYLTL